MRTPQAQTIERPALPTGKKVHVVTKGEEHLMESRRGKFHILRQETEEGVRYLPNHDTHGAQRSRPFKRLGLSKIWIDAYVFHLGPSGDAAAAHRGADEALRIAMKPTKTDRLDN